MTDGSGNATFNVAFAVMPVGEYITATATDETSENSFTFHAFVDSSVAPLNLVITTGAPFVSGSMSDVFRLAEAHAGPDNVIVDPSVSVIFLERGIVITSPVNFNGLVGGEKVVINCFGMPPGQSCFDVRVDGNKFRNFKVFGVPVDVFQIHSSNNEISDGEIGGDKPAQRIGGNAFRFFGVPVPGSRNNTVRDSTINNVGGSGIIQDPGAGVAVQQLKIVSTGTPVQASGGPPPAQIISQAPGTVTIRVNGANGSSGSVTLYVVTGTPVPEFSGNLEPQTQVPYQIIAGGFAELTIPVTDPGVPAALTILRVENGTIANLSFFDPLATSVPIVLPPLTTAGNLESYRTPEPVNLFTGEYFDLLAPDLDLGGPLPLFFQRYYASFLQRDGKAAGKLGNNWLHNFEWSLTNKTSTVEIVSPMGRVITFTNNNGAFVLTGRQDIPYQLEFFFGSGHFVLADPRSQQLFRFDQTGKLILILDGHGNSHNLTYTGTQLASVSDGLGRTLTFQYNPAGFLTNVSDGIRSVGFAQSNADLVQSSDPLGKTSANLYTSFPFPGLLTERQRPLGNTRFTQVYDQLGRVSQQYQLDPSDETRFTYGFNMATETDPFGFEREYYHNSNGEFIGFADEANRTATMTYNASGQRVSATDRRGNTTLLGFHAPSGRIAALTNADGTITQFAYTNRNFGGITFHDLSRITYPDGTTETFSRDASGNITAFTDRAGKVSRFTYNTRGQMLSSTNPTGGMVMFTYNSDGTLAAAADSETGATSFSYDTHKRLTNMVHADGTSRSWTYDANDRLLSVTDERANTTSFAYDANDRLIQIIDGNGDTAGFDYDSADRIVTLTNSAGNIATIQYDDRGHVSTVLDFNGVPTSFTVDGQHRLTGLDQSGQSWELGYNNEAQLTSVTNPLAQITRFARDTLGFTTGSTNPLGHATSSVLDVMRRLTNMVDPLQRAARFAYDARGLLAGATAPVVGTASFERNDLGLLTRIIGLNGEQWNFGYSPMGRLQFVADPLNRTNRVGYDNRGRQVSAAFADGTTVSNTLDGAGNVVRRQFSAGPDLTFAYDNVNRLTNAADVALAYDSEGRLTNTISSGVNYGAGYDVGGRLSTVSYHNGAFAVTYGYNSRNELITVSDSLTGTMIQFIYDAAGRLTNIIRPSLVNSSFTYDTAGRLTRLREGNFVDIQYTLDAAAQIVQAGFTAPLDPESLLTNNQAAPFTYDAAHQINNAGYGYDARGRLIASPGKTFAWDGASRLTGIGAVALGYNGLDDVITRAEGGVTMRYYYKYAVGLAPIMTERNETTAQVQRYYVWTPGGRLLYLIDAANGNAVRHFHFDQVGTTLALTDSAGAVTDAYAYTPYGVLLDRSGNNAQPFTYIGAYGVRAEPAANLYQMRARYYDPVSARFLSRDPIWPTLDGLDPYEYAVANPLTYIDPLGLQAQFTTTSTIDLIAPNAQTGSVGNQVLTALAPGTIGGPVPGADTVTISYGGAQVSVLGALSANLTSIGGLITVINPNLPVASVTDPISISSLLATFSAGAEASSPPILRDAYVLRGGTGIPFGPADPLRYDRWFGIQMVQAVLELLTSMGYSDIDASRLVANYVALTVGRKPGSPSAAVGANPFDTARFTANFTQGHGVAYISDDNFAVTSQGFQMLSIAPTLIGRPGIFESTGH